MRITGGAKVAENGFLLEGRTPGSDCVPLEPVPPPNSHDLGIFQPAET